MKQRKIILGLLPTLSVLGVVILLAARFFPEPPTPPKQVESPPPHGISERRAAPHTPAKTETPEIKTAEVQKNTTPASANTASAKPAKEPVEENRHTLILLLNPDVPIDPQGPLAEYRDHAETHAQLLSRLNVMLLDVPARWDLDELSETLRQDPAVRTVTKDVKMKLHVTPNDPEVNDQGPWTSIDAFEAWNYTTGSRDPVVAVLDTGIDYTHPDLVNNLWINEAELNGTTGRDDDGNGYIDDVYGANMLTGGGDPWDDDYNGSHGTAVAGTIAAEGNNGLLLSGVVWKTRIMSVKVFDAQGNGSLVLLAIGINYVLEMKSRGVNVRVINYSGGEDPTEPDDPPAVREEKIRVVRDLLQMMASEDALFVTAAGNDKTYLDSDEIQALPATLESTTSLTVGATVSRSGARAYFSNYGPRVHLGAPGFNIPVLQSGFSERQWNSPVESFINQEFGGRLRDLPNWEATPDQSWTAVIHAADSVASLNNSKTTAVLTYLREIDLSPYENVENHIIFHTRTKYRLPTHSCPPEFIRRNHPTPECDLLNQALLELQFKTYDTDWETWIYWYENSLFGGNGYDEDLFFTIPLHHRKKGFRLRFRYRPLVSLASMNETNTAQLPDDPATTPPPAEYFIDKVRLFNVIPTSTDATTASVNGTSFSSPIVAGAAALILAHRPDLSLVQVRNAILENVDPLPEGTSCQGRFGRETPCFQTGGSLNLHKAIAWVTTPAIVTSPLSPLLTVKGAADTLLSVRLARTPGIFSGIERVAVSLRLEGPAAEAGTVTLTRTSLTYDAANWHVPQSVVIESVNIRSNSTASLVITVNEGSDPDYAGLKQSVPIHIVGNELLGLENVRLDEGSSHTFNLTLSRQHPKNSLAVTFSLSPDDAGQLVIEPRQITFTHDNWNMPQPLRVAAPHNLLQNDDYEVLLTAATDGIDLFSNTVRISVTDNRQLPDITLMTGDSLPISDGVLRLYGNQSTTLNVMLAGQPASGMQVRIGLLHTMSGITVRPDTLVFEPGNWNVPQLVHVTTPPTDVLTVSSLTFTVDDSSSDPQFHGVMRTIRLALFPPQPALLVSANQISLTENQIQTFTMRLNQPPGGFNNSTRVIIIATTNNPRLGSYPQRVVFTDGRMNTRTTPGRGGVHWATSQTLQINAAPDQAFGDYEAELYLRAAAENSDPDFAGIAETIALQIKNDDLFVLGLENVSLDEGNSHSFNLTLTTKPAAETVIVSPKIEPVIAGLTTQTRPVVFTRQSYDTTRHFTVFAPLTSEDPRTQETVVTIPYGRPSTAKITVIGNTQFAGFEILPTTVLHVSYPSTRVEVRLTGRPFSKVGFITDNSSPTDVVIQPTTFFFTPERWQKTQYLRFRSRTVASPGTAYVIISVKDEESDQQFHSVPSKTVKLLVTPAETDPVVRLRVRALLEGALQ